MERSLESLVQYNMCMLCYILLLYTWAPRGHGDFVVCLSDQRDAPSTGGDAEFSSPATRRESFPLDPWR